MTIRSAHITINTKSIVGQHEDPQSNPEEFTVLCDCPICLEQVPKTKCVSCPNGHSCCEKHFLQRTRAIYEEGDLVYGERDGQQCFLCREPIDEDVFSDVFWKNMSLIQYLGLQKIMNDRISVRTETKEERNMGIEHIQRLMCKLPAFSGWDEFHR